MDAISLDCLIAELAPLAVGRHLSRPRLAAPDALLFELGGQRERWLWLDVGRGTAGAYLVPRDLARRLADADGAPVPGRARQALLHLRKHADGVRLRGLARVAGERTLVLDGGDVTLALRVGGAAPALTLALEGAALGTLGDGVPAWPLPQPRPEREWDRVDAAGFAAAVAAGLAEGRSAVRAILAACPGLGPRLARETDGSAASFAALVERLSSPRPTLHVPCSPGEWRDALLAPAEAVLLAPIALEWPAGTRLEPGSWLEAAALLLEARRRGRAFERLRRAALDTARRDLRRLSQLEENLAGDLAKLQDEGRLRREGEALLAFAHRLPAGAETAELPDPYDPQARLLVRLDPRLAGAANADRLFDKARRVERARREIELRRRETRSALVAAHEREASVLEAVDAGQLGPHGPRPRTADEARAVGPRHYLTSRGLSVLVGRGARENHHLTFRVARPEDVWLHAREAPGAHVVLRDNEGRAGAEDLREAAELAAFFSEARGSALVDVHVTRRKHVRPARGGPGRVFVAHSDTLRVCPRDPEGRLRRR